MKSGIRLTTHFANRIFRETKTLLPRQGIALAYLNGVIMARRHLDTNPVQGTGLVGERLGDLPRLEAADSCRLARLRLLNAALCAFAVVTGFLPVAAE